MAAGVNTSWPPAFSATLPLVTATAVPPRVIDWPFTAKDYYHAPGMKPDLDALQRNIALMKDLGFTKSDIDVKKYSDLSLIEAAGARLK